MSTASRHPRRDANHIRIYAFASMTTVLHFLMKNFKRSGSPQYSSITAAALLCYSIALPLAHMAQLELVYTRASDMRVVQVAMNRPKHIIYALATIITASFVGPGIFSVYSLLGMGGSKSSLEFALWVLGWGTLALVVVDIAALFISFAMFATFSSYIQVCGIFHTQITLTSSFRVDSVELSAFASSSHPQQCWEIPSCLHKHILDQGLYKNLPRTS